jgi:UDP-N-acetylglucosamine 4-epimerase
MDNFATGHKHNLKDFVNPNFRLIEGDIRSTVDCQNAVKDVDYVLHQAFGLCSTFY